MNSAAVKKLKSAKLWVLFSVVAAAVWGFAFYWISRPSRSQKLEVWLGAAFGLKPSVTAEIERAAAPYGIKECDVNDYDPADAYYAQAFSLRANSVDIYILDRQTAETLAQTGIFAPVTFAFDGAEYLRLDDTDNIYGVRFVGDYYIFVNSASKKTDALLKDVIAVLVKAGAEA